MVQDKRFVDNLGILLRGGLGGRRVREGGGEQRTSFINGNFLRAKTTLSCSEAWELVFKDHYYSSSTYIKRSFLFTRLGFNRSIHMDLFYDTSFLDLLCFGGLDFQWRAETSRFSLKKLCFKD